MHAMKLINPSLTARHVALVVIIATKSNRGLKQFTPVFGIRYRRSANEDDSSSAVSALYSFCMAAISLDWTWSSNSWISSWSSSSEILSSSTTKLIWSFLIP